MGSYGGVQSYKMMKRYGNNKKLLIYGYIPDHLNRNVRSCAPSYSPLCLNAPSIRKNNGQYEIEKFVFENNLKDTTDITQLINKRSYFNFKIHIMHTE